MQNLTGPDCKQISFQRQYDGRLVPVFRHSINSPWVPCEQSQIEAPSKYLQGLQSGFSKWQAMLKSGYEVIKT